MRLALFLCAITAGVVIARVLPPMDATARLLAQAAINIALVLALYKLVIVRLGERPRDDLPAAGAAKNLLIGLLIGVVLITAVVGVAALFDVYNIVGEGGTSQLLRLLDRNRDRARHSRGDLLSAGSCSAGSRNSPEAGPR